MTPHMAPCPANTALPGFEMDSKLNFCRFWKHRKA